MRYSERVLADYTSLKTGGPAFSWFEAEDLDNILEAIDFANESSKPLAIIGKGTNILVKDAGFKGVIIRLGAGFDYIEREDHNVLKVGASSAISKLVAKSVKWGLSGCEFLTGIPGSFGGSVSMNTGVRDIDYSDKYREIKDILIDIDVLDIKKRKIETLSRADIPFNYRSSGLEGKCILSGRIKLEKDDSRAIVNTLQAFLEQRTWINNLNFPSAGSVFKNPGKDNPAGRLIESCGLKGRRVGGAMFSQAHANVIVNIDRATSKDIMELIELAKKNVREKFGIDLELELKTIE